jgi:hypothetical protein
MASDSEFIRDELPDVATIISNECWLEGQRRGCSVDPSDPIIRQRVADIILSGAGEYMRRIRGGMGNPQEA